MTHVQPAVGQWYLSKEWGRRFEVVGIDENEGTIELQDEEGSLDEMDRDTWSNAELEFTAQPQDLTEVFDDVSEPDDADGEDTSDADLIGPEPSCVTDDELSDDRATDDRDEENDQDED
jgi:hypothetical protein